MKRSLFPIIAALTLTACQTMDAPSRSLTLAEFQARALKFKSQITVPTIETTPEAVQKSLKDTLATANAALDFIAARPPGQMTFANTIRALDDVMHAAGTTANRLSLIKETSQSEAVRDAATEAIKTFQDWAVGLEYREDLYAAVKTFAATNPKVAGEDEKFFREVLRDYKRAGLDLPKEPRQEVERLRKEVARLSTDFESNINKTQAPVKFTRAELDGVPESFLAQKGIKTGDDEFTVLANVTFHYVTVMENARREETRRKLLLVRDNLTRAENVPLLQKIVELRDTIGGKLGYKTWADYVIEPKMAKDAATARAFCEKLATGLQPKFDAEVQELAALKSRDTGNAQAKIEIWDWRYYANQLKKEKYNVDAEQLRVFFPYQKTLEGMFTVYQRIFGLKFTALTPPAKWVDDLQLYAVADAKTGEPLGLFYLDMFPREGKFNHFAQFGIIEGKRLPSGVYQRPTVALVCNFPAPQPDRPSLLSHQDVTTLFHEFGHAMHSILTRADYSRFAGTSVPRDFVEAPSQMFENWVWDKQVLDGFAADYRDPKKKIPQDVLKQLKAAKLATIGHHYRRQMSFALTDLALHTQVHAGVDVLNLSNETLSRVFLPLAPDTAFCAYFGHLMGYDAAYYGYGWADAIAADLATVFEQSPRGYFDEKVGRRLRDEIYAPGDSRDVNESIERFLGRPRSLEPFLRKIGIESTPAKN